MTADSEVLHTSQDIRKAIRRIFDDPKQRRVAIVAFVGKGALAHLPKPKGVEVYCWPHPGGTNADAVEVLRARKAKVFFADRVHMKVYWASKRGAVVASANLSDNAFGIGGLREAGVRVPSSMVDIDGMIRLIEPKPVTKGALAGLRRESAERENANGQDRSTIHIPSFDQWYDGQRGAKWKWDYWDIVGGGFSRRAKKAVKMLDPTYVPVKYVECERGMLREEDRVLRVKLTNKGVMQSPEWLYVERVVLVEKNDRVYNGDYPFQAVQAREDRHCPPPPFRIDSRFKKALRQVSTNWGSDRVRAQVASKPPTPSFLAAVRDAY